MKCVSALTAAIALGITACDTLNRPITSGDFDPLRPPGSNNSPSAASAPMFKAGQFVLATINNTAFFKNRPKGEGDADKLLPRGTSMKVISHSNSYVKVELDSGEIGFVPAVMVEDPNATGSAMPPMNPGEIQVYPPISGYGEPLPMIPPGEAPPEGAIPTVIDPEAPAAGTPIPPIPPVAPTTDTFPAPVEPKSEPAPLPPNDEDLAAQKNPAENAAEKPAEKTGDPAPKLEE